MPRNIKWYGWVPDIPDPRDFMYAGFLDDSRSNRGIRDFQSRRITAVIARRELTRQPLRLDGSLGRERSVAMTGDVADEAALNLAVVR